MDVNCVIGLSIYIFYGNFFVRFTDFFFLFNVNLDVVFGM